MRPQIGAPAPQVQRFDLEPAFADRQARRLDQLEPFEAELDLRARDLPRDRHLARPLERAAQAETPREHRGRRRRTRQRQWSVRELQLQIERQLRPEAERAAGAPAEVFAGELHAGLRALEAQRSADGPDRHPGDHPVRARHTQLRAARVGPQGQLALQVHLTRERETRGHHAFERGQPHHGLGQAQLQTTGRRPPHATSARGEGRSRSLHALEPDLVARQDEVGFETLDTLARRTHVVDDDPARARSGADRGAELGAALDLRIEIEQIQDAPQLDVARRQLQLGDLERLEPEIAAGRERLRALPQAQLAQGEPSVAQHEIDGQLLERQTTPGGLLQVGAHLDVRCRGSQNDARFDRAVAGERDPRCGAGSTPILSRKRSVAA